MRFASRPSCIKRLLVIEDDPLVAFDNEHTLKHSGYNVVATVDSGEAAVAVMAAEAIDAIVLDLGLAGPMSGREVARDRKSVVDGQCVSVRVDLGGRRVIKKKTEEKPCKKQQLSIQNNT